MVADKTYVRTDEHGSMRVGNTRVSLDSVVIGFQQGQAPETIQRNYPALTLEQVYGAVAYYLANRRHVDEYLRRQRDEWDRVVAEQERNPPPPLRRLRILNSVPEFRAIMTDPLLDSASREDAISRLFSELPSRVAAGEVTQEQATALEAWRERRRKSEREELFEKLYLDLADQISSGTITPEQSAALEALRQATRNAAPAGPARPVEARP